MCGVLTDYTLSSEWRHMKSQVIQKPVVVILGNAGNIGYLAAKAFACQGTVVAMLHEAGEESCHIVDCLPGSSHLVMSGRLNHSSDLASFAGLVHTLYGRVDYLIICEDASVEVQGLSCSSRVRLSVLLEHAFVSGAMIVNMVSRSGKKGSMGGRYRGLGKLPEPERCQNEPDRNSPSGISVCFPVSIGFFRLCGCVVFMWERRSPYSPGIYRGQWKESCLAARQAAGIIPVPV